MVDYLCLPEGNPWYGVFGAYQGLKNNNAFLCFWIGQLIVEWFANHGRNQPSTSDLISHGSYNSVVGFVGNDLSGDSELSVGAKCTLFWIKAIDDATTTVKTAVAIDSSGFMVSATYCDSTAAIARWLDTKVVGYTLEKSGYRQKGLGLVEISKPWEVKCRYTCHK